MKLSKDQRTILTMLRKYGATSPSSTQLCTRATEVAHGSVSLNQSRTLQKLGLVVVMPVAGGNVAYLTEEGLAAEATATAPKPLKGQRTEDNAYRSRQR